MLNCGNTYKYLDACAGGFYNLKKILTYNRPWSFITGSRSVGKSTAVAIFFICDYLKNGNKFIYTRRTKDETLYTCATFFSNAVAIINDKTEFQINKLWYDGGKYWLKRDGREDAEQCGCIIPLSQEQKHKSNNYSEYCNLVYDEFICQDSTNYLGSKATPYREYRAALSLYQTIDRGIEKPFRNETRFFFLGNTATIYNPIFLSLNISGYIESNSRFIAPKNKLWILERVEAVDATAEIEKSFAFLLSGEDERNYAYRNKGYDKEAYIKHPPENSRHYICTLCYTGRKFGVWTDEKTDKFYIDKYANIGYAEISLDADSHNENDLMLVTKWSDYPIISTLLEKFRRNKLYFGNGRIKNTFQRYFNLMP